CKSTLLNDRYTVKLCITVPENGAVLTGNVPVIIEPELSGSNPPDIRELVFYLNDEYLLLDNLPTKFIELPTAHFLDGNYKLGVLAIMNDNRITNLTEINLRFSNGTFTPPVNNRTF